MHISPEQGKEQEQEGPVITHAIGGNYVKVKIPGKKGGKGGYRGRVQAFSNASRRRLLVVVNSINQTTSGPGEFAFVTLTYPANYPTASASKRDLDTWLKRFERAWGQRGLIWKLEPQKRGAPHYHLLVYMGRNFDASAMLTWTANAWHDIAGQGEPMHLAVHLGQAGGNSRPCVEVVNDWAGVARYAGKYLGKLIVGDEEWQHPGRYWGVRRNELLPITLESHAVSLNAAHKLRRLLVRWWEHQPSGWWYFPGKKIRGWTGAGGKQHPARHTPGKRWHGSTIVNGSLSPDGMPRPLRQCVDYIGDMLEVKPRQQFKRWGRSSGGISCFISAAAFNRMIDGVNQSILGSRGS